MQTDFKPFALLPLHAESLQGRFICGKDYLLAHRYFTPGMDRVRGYFVGGLDPCRDIEDGDVASFSVFKRKTGLVNVFEQFREQPPIMFKPVSPAAFDGLILNKCFHDEPGQWWKPKNTTAHLAHYPRTDPFRALELAAMTTMDHIALIKPPHYSSELKAETALSRMLELFNETLPADAWRKRFLAHIRATRNNSYKREKTARKTKNLIHKLKNTARNQ